MVSSKVTLKLLKQSLYLLRPDTDFERHPFSTRDPASQRVSLLVRPREPHPDLGTLVAGRILLHLNLFQVDCYYAITLSPVL
jgi:hypothetical protein